MREKYEAWRSSKSDLKPGDSRIVSRWDQFVRGAGKAKDAGPDILDAVRAWQCNKCAWCESVEPETIDHVAPKVQFPDVMFNWDNILASCGDCNNARSHHNFDFNHLLVPTRDEPLKHFRWEMGSGACIYDPSDLRAKDTWTVFIQARYQHERLLKLVRVRTFFAFLVGDRYIEETLARLKEELDPRRPYLCILRSWLLHPPNEDERDLRDRGFAKEPCLIDCVRPWLNPGEGCSWQLISGKCEKGSIHRGGPG